MNTLRRYGPLLAALALMVAASLYAWGRIPERVPVHWGIDGEATRYGGRLEALGLLPAVTLALVALAALVPREARNEALVRAVLRTVALGLAALHVGVVATYLGAEIATPRLAGFVVGVVFLGTGNLLPKAQPSRWVGVRTPWTFGSKESWHRSQRLAGWVMTLSGGVFILTALLTPSAAALFAVVALTLLALLSVVGYGYRVWRRDEAREPSL
jgi:uncharacterized membrane protein